ncbi:MAG TPA: phenylacetate--CoA ligase [Spirochaetia bacterium]|nr:phenylacetate--CoA ligase [Spirochaetia bacterium]
MDISYWNGHAETISRDALKEHQLERLKETVEWALKTPFYGPRLAEIGIKSSRDIRSLEDLNRIPYTTKDDLRQAFPYGLLAREKSDVVRIHVSSGTTGIPTVIYHSRADLENWTELLARCIVATGSSKEDVFQNMMTYGLFTGGLGLHYGAERVGMMVIPSGPGNTKRQFRLMKDFQTTVVHATPSYLLHLYSKHQEEGVSLSEIALRKAYVGAEPHSENTRKKIEGLFHIDVYNSYGLSEMNGPGVAFECIYKNGMHVWEDAYILEIIHPDSLEALGEEQEGELVFTTLNRSATPLLRYRTRDLSLIQSGPCPCGRTHRRIERIKGRTDDMLIINGVNVFPSQIEEVLMKMPEVGTNYQIVIEKKGALDQLTVKTEVTPRIFSDDSRVLNTLRTKIKDNLKASIAIGPVVELHEPGVLPVTEGKAVRVIDIRDRI